ncbi:MAG TPA: response regulator transcription factor [Xanthobacteraceae bacterium]|jgi:DNA-binding NarL/FixJ family response regulator|nr:response regulator transcription factor [Xanthobacteraceae bacterium]
MKILLSDDHALIREAVRGVLRELAPDASVIEASDGARTLELIERHPDIEFVLLDLNLPDRDGLALLGDLRAQYPAMSVVVLSAFQDQVTIRQALRLGALGFIPKNTERDVMLNALRLVFAGGIYVPVEALDRPAAAPAASGRTHADLRRGLPPGLALTERQLDVLALIMEGKSNKAISRELDVAEHTVKNHVTAIFKALNVASRTEAMVAVGRLTRDARRTS